MPISDDDRKALEGFQLAARLSGHDVQLVEPGPYKQFDFTAHLAKWMIEHSFATGHGACFDDLLAELSWQIKELRARVPKPQ